MLNKVDGMSFPEAIKQFRKQNDLTQAEFAQVLGVSAATVSFWERGKVEPKQKIVWEKIYNLLPELRDERLTKNGLKYIQEGKKKHGSPQDAILFTLLRWQSEFEFFKVEYGDNKVIAKLKLDTTNTKA